MIMNNESAGRIFFAPDGAAEGTVVINQRGVEVARQKLAESKGEWMRQFKINNNMVKIGLASDQIDLGIFCRAIDKDAKNLSQVSVEELRQIFWRLDKGLGHEFSVALMVEDDQQQISLIIKKKTIEQ